MSEETKPAEEQTQAPAIPPPSPQTPMIVEQEGALIARWSMSTPTFATNFDTTTTQGRVILTQGMSKCKRMTRNVVGQRLELIGFVVHEVEMPSISGEFERKLRGAMITSDYEVISTMSGPVLECLCRLARTRGKGIWEPPSIVEIREWTISEKGSYCDMIELMPTDDDPAPKPKKK